MAGAGAFGVTAALELRRRGHAVELLDAGTPPHPRASSTDISKAVRMDYGGDGFYSELALRAIEGWRAWNQRWGGALYHEVGILLLAGGPMTPEGFEGASFRLLAERGVPLERIDRASLSRRFPAWSSAAYEDGYFNPRAGWVESGRVMGHLVEEARAAGVAVRENVAVRGLAERGSRVTGVVLAGGEILRAEYVVVAAGAWTPVLLPQLDGAMWATGQPVLHFEPPDPRPFDGRRFPVWCADIANTGWYGFPVNAAGLLKVGHHGVGRRHHAGDLFEVPASDVRRFREFVGRTFPDLAAAPVRGSRLCLYCDTWDGDFWIDHDPERPGLMVACGGSGHAFKFAPLLGGIIADVLEGLPNADARRFAWRAPGARRTEHARKKP